MEVEDEERECNDDKIEWVFFFLNIVILKGHKKMEDSSEKSR